MDYCSPAQVKSLCAEFGFQFTKSLGQNFLISPEIVERIADSAGLDAETALRGQTRKRVERLRAENEKTL